MESNRGFYEYARMRSTKKSVIMVTMDGPPNGSDGKHPCFCDGCEHKFRSDREPDKCPGCGIRVRLVTPYGFRANEMD